MLITCFPLMLGEIQQFGSALFNSVTLSLYRWLLVPSWVMLWIHVQPGIELIWTTECTHEPHARLLDLQVADINAL